MDYNTTILPIIIYTRENSKLYGSRVSALTK